MELTPGKRYRWTVEGTADAKGWIHLSSAQGKYLGSFGPSMVACGTVELLPDPLPTTPGSVIRWADRSYLLREDGWWQSPSGASCTPNVIGEDATVLFDAGAERA